MSDRELRDMLTGAILSMQETGVPEKGQELQTAVHEAAVSGDPELKGLAAAAAYYMVERYFTTVAKRHQDMYGRPEVADFLGDLKIFILENIDRYDPANSPATWLEHRYMPVFQETKNAEYGIKRTIHQTRVDRLVAKAKGEIFKATGNATPTEMEVYDFLNASEETSVKGKVSIEAIKKALEGVSVYTSHEMLGMIPDASQLPEKSLMAKAMGEEFLAAVKKLSKRSREVILTETAYNEEHGESPSEEELTAVLRERFPEATPEEIAKYIYSAHSEMRRKYRKKTASDSPVNQMGEEEMGAMEEEERMVIEAIEEDASILDFL